MLSKEDKRRLRGKIFRHLDGLVTAPSAYVLHKQGVLETILSRKEIEISELSELHEANEGYLNVALRVLCSQGWLEQEIDNRANTVVFRTNERSTSAFGKVGAYEDAVELMKFSASFHPRKFEVEPFRLMESIATKFLDSRIEEASVDADDIDAQIQAHIEGVLLGPTIVLLGMSGMFHKYFMESFVQTRGVSRRR